MENLIQRLDPRQGRETLVENAKYLTTIVAISSTIALITSVSDVADKFFKSFSDTLFRGIDMNAESFARPVHWIIDEVSNLFNYAPEIKNMDEINRCYNGICNFMQ